MQGSRAASPTLLSGCVGDAAGLGGSGGPKASPQVESRIRIPPSVPSLSAYIPATEPRLVAPHAISNVCEPSNVTHRCSVTPEAAALTSSFHSLPFVECLLDRTELGLVALIHGAANGRLTSSAISCGIPNPLERPTNYVASRILYEQYETRRWRAAFTSPSPAAVRLEQPSGCADPHDMSPYRAAKRDYESDMLAFSSSDVPDTVQRIRKWCTTADYRHVVGRAVPVGDATPSPRTFTPYPTDLEDPISAVRAALVRALGFNPVLNRCGGLFFSDGQRAMQMLTVPRLVLDSAEATESQHRGTSWRVSHPAVSAPAERRYYYAEEQGDDLRTNALVDWFHDVVVFCVQRTFSSVQTQRVLLLAEELVSLLTAPLPPLAQDRVDATPPGDRLGGGEDTPSDDDVHVAVADLLTTRLQPLCVSHHTVALVRMPVLHDVDQRARSAERQSLMRPKSSVSKLSKRRKLTLANDADSVQLGRRGDRQRIVRIEQVEKLVAVEPIFSFREAEEILAFFSSTLLQHWRLLRYVVTQPQPRTLRPITTTISDVPGFCVPPLDCFSTVKQFGQQQRRRELERECAVTLAQSFETDVTAPLAALQPEFDEVNSSVRAQLRQLELWDCEDSLSGAEYNATRRALQCRLLRKIRSNESTRHPPACSDTLQPVTTHECSPSAVAVPPDGPAPKIPAKSDKGGRSAVPPSRVKSGAPKAAVAEADRQRSSANQRKMGSASLVVPAVEVRADVGSFSIEDVHRRIDAADKAADAAAAKQEPARPKVNR